MSTDGSSLFEAQLMRDIRDRFASVDSDPYCGERIYFENAGGSLTLNSVVDAVAHWTAIPDNAGRENPTSRELTRVIEQGREDLCTLLGARGGTVALAESTTTNAFRVLGAVVRSLPGNNLVTTNLDHPATYDSTRILAERSGKQWRVAELSPNSGIVEPEAVSRLIDPETVVLAVIHSSNILGTANDVKAIIQAARAVKPELFVLVDGAQHAPHRLIDVEDLECDAYLVSSYKTFGKPGGSAAYLSPRAAELPHDQLLGKGRTDWELGTREPAVYAAWSEILAYLCWLGGEFTSGSDKRRLAAAGMQAIRRHERALVRRLLGNGSLKGLLDIPGVTVYGDPDSLGVKEPVFALGVRGLSSTEVVHRLARRGIVVHTRVSDAYSKHTLAVLGFDECVRVSLAHYNTADEVDSFLEALVEIAS